MAEQRDERAEPLVVTHSPSGSTRHGGGVPRDHHAADTSDGAGLAAGAVELIIAALLIVVVVAQNGERVRFEFLWWDADVPLAVLLLVAAVVTLIIDQLVGLMWRRRRRRMRAMSSAERHG